MTLNIINTKNCSVCRQILPLSSFNRWKLGKDGHQNSCRGCNQTYTKAWYHANAEYCKERTSKWVSSNRAKYRSIQRKAQRSYRLNPTVRLSQAVGCAVRRMIGKEKNGRKWNILLGYTSAVLKLHLEKQFQPGMTWENYGEWQIDHIKPISLFKFSSFNDPEFKACWSLNNLQPLWVEDNISKSNNYDS